MSLIDFIVSWLTGLFRGQLEQLKITNRYYYSTVTCVNVTTNFSWRQNREIYGWFVQNICFSVPPT